MPIEMYRVIYHHLGAIVKGSRAVHHHPSLCREQNLEPEIHGLLTLWGLRAWLLSQVRFITFISHMSCLFDIPHFYWFNMLHTWNNSQPRSARLYFHKQHYWFATVQGCIVARSVVDFLVRHVFFGPCFIKDNVGEDVTEQGGLQNKELQKVHYRGKRQRWGLK